jgi:hypothetical protein
MQCGIAHRVHKILKRGPIARFLKRSLLDLFRPSNPGQRRTARRPVLDMLGVFAEFETNLRRERQLEGIGIVGGDSDRKPANRGRSQRRAVLQGCAALTTRTGACPIGSARQRLASPVARRRGALNADCSMDTSNCATSLYSGAGFAQVGIPNPVAPFYTRTVFARSRLWDWGTLAGLSTISENTNEDGALIFQKAHKIGLEGIVSKRLSASYRSGPSRDWIKVKNPDSPAMIRAGKSSGDAMFARSVEDKIEPMDLANVRQSGVRSLLVMCFGCRHEVILNVDQYPGDPLVREFGPRMVCTKCGMVGADVRPNLERPGEVTSSLGAGSCVSPKALARASRRPMEWYEAEFSPVALALTGSIAARGGSCFAIAS